MTANLLLTIVKLALTCMLIVPNIASCAITLTINWEETEHRHHLGR
jgi:hypothetical protein